MVDALETPSRPASAAIVGAGPAGLMAAETLARAGVAVTVYDQMPSPARKFLLAGRGGLNLTHSEPLDAFVARYRERSPEATRLLTVFPPAALRDWADALGAETFVGSSGRVFPKAMKASPLLRAWLRRLEALGVALRVRHRWTGWTAHGALTFSTPDGDVAPRHDVAVLALGGASWPRLGSDGAWTDMLRARGVPVTAFRPANAGLHIEWSVHFRSRFAGAPIKNARFSAGGADARGDAMVTEAGLEDGPIYALCAEVRDNLDRSRDVRMAIDLRPDETVETLASRIAAVSAGASSSERLRRGARLAPVAQSLLREAVLRDAHGALPREPAHLARLIKQVVLPVSGVAPLSRAISTAGGIPFEALNDALMLRAVPGVFAAGEMLDWEAPTGGYLLQATLASGVCAAQGALSWLAARAIATGPQAPMVSTEDQDKEGAP